MGEIAAANVIASLLTPKPTDDESDGVRPQLGKGKVSQKELLKKMDLTGLWDWHLEE